MTTHNPIVADVLDVKTGEQRWQYRQSGGQVVWLPFDPAFPCFYCDEPVRSLSLGGPGVCPRCDCGYSENGKWTMEEAYCFGKHARERLNSLPFDPIWNEYEALRAAALEAKG